MMETQTHKSSPAAVSTEHGIDVEQLEQELASMWTALREGEKGSAGGAGSVDAEPASSVTRACVLNLIVFAPAGEDRSAAEALLEETTEEHPSRVLLLVIDRGTDAERLEAYVSTRCRPTMRGAKQICGEQVTIEASGSVVERVASAVSPLLVPDVPVFLWWRDIPHAQDGLFSRLVRLADRVVLDSAASDRPHQDLARLARLIAERGDAVRISDLNWGRLTTWRVLLASFWDSNAYRPFLDGIDRVIVEYNSSSSADDDDIPAQALLIAGWLASRLGWQPETMEAERGVERTRARLRSAEGREVEVEFRAVDSHPECVRMLKALTLRAEEADAEFHVEFRPERTKLETRATLRGQHTVGRILAYESKSEGKRLSRELGLLARDEVYEQAVLAVAGLLEKMGVREESV